MSDKQTHIDLSLSVGKVGLKVHVKASREIEEFFKQLHLEAGYQDIREDYGSVRNTWFLSSEAYLPYYRIPSQWLEALSSAPTSRSYELNAIGNPLVNPATDQVNLSVLRLVGISSDDGITFTMPGVVTSTLFLTSLENRIASAVKMFYSDMFKPHGVRVSLMTESW